MSHPHDAPWVVHNEDVAWEYLSEAPEQGAMRWKTLVGGEGSSTQNLTFGICEVPPGRQVPPHHHSDDEVYYVAEGDGEVLLGDTIVPVKPGTALHVPGNLVHGIRNVSDKPLVLLWAFATHKLSDVRYHGVERDF